MDNDKISAKWIVVMILSPLIAIGIGCFVIFHPLSNKAPKHSKSSPNVMKAVLKRGLPCRKRYARASKLT